MREIGEYGENHDPIDPPSLIPFVFFVSFVLENPESHR